MDSIHQSSPPFWKKPCPDLTAQNVDAFVRYYDSPVGGVGKNHSHKQVPMVVEAEDRSKIQIEMDGQRCADESIAIVGPIREATAPSVVELELWTIDNVAVAITENGIAVAQIDGCLAIVVDEAIHAVVLETEVEAYVGVVEIGFPTFFSIGLTAYADVGTIHRTVGIEWDMTAVSQRGFNIEALGRKPYGC